jgi:hypothetical protein
LQQEPHATLLSLQDSTSVVTAPPFAFQLLPGNQDLRLSEAVKLLCFERMKSYDLKMKYEKNKLLVL